MTGSHPSTADNHRRWHAGVLSVVAGAADTIGFLAFDAFAGLMTGNTVLLGIALTRGDWARSLTSVCIILSFLAGIAVASVLHRMGIGLTGLLSLEAVAMVAATFLGIGVAAPLLAFAMGLQNAAATRFAGVTLNTVFLTGDLQKLVSGLIARLADRGSPLQEKPELLVLGYVYVGYCIGVILGALAHTHLTHPLLYFILLLPIVLLPFGTSETRPIGSAAPLPPGAE